MLSSAILRTIDRVSLSPAAKPSNLLLAARESTALAGQPTAVSTLRSDGGIEMPRSLSRLWHS